MRKRVQEGDALKQTNLKILLHLLQKISLDNIWFPHILPTSTYTKKENNITSFSYLNLMQLHSHKFGPN